MNILPGFGCLPKCAISSPWNYKVLSDIFVKIELFTFSYSVAIFLHYVMCFVHLGSLLFLCLKETCSPYTHFPIWNAKTLKLNISKLLRTQIEPYNSKGTI